MTKALFANCHFLLIQDICFLIILSCLAERVGDHSTCYKNLALVERAYYWTLDTFDFIEGK